MPVRRFVAAACAAEVNHARNDFLCVVYGIKASLDIDNDADGYRLTMERHVKTNYASLRAAIGKARKAILDPSSAPLIGAFLFWGRGQWRALGHHIASAIANRRHLAGFTQRW